MYNNSGTLKRFVDSNLESLQQDVVDLLYVRLFLQPIDETQWVKLINQWLSFRYKKISWLRGCMPDLQQIICDTIKQTTIDVDALFNETIKNAIKQSIQVYNSKDFFSRVLIASYRSKFPNFPFSPARIAQYERHFLELIDIQAKETTKNYFLSVILKRLLLLITVFGVIHVLVPSPIRAILSPIFITLCIYELVTIKQQRIAFIEKIIVTAEEDNPGAALDAALLNALKIEYQPAAGSIKVTLAEPHTITEVEENKQGSTSSHAYLTQRGISHIHPASSSSSLPVATSLTDSINKPAMEHKLHYPGEIYLTKNDYALLDVDAMSRLDKTVKENIRKTFAKGFKNSTTSERYKSSGIVPLKFSINNYFYKMNLIGDTKARCYATIVINNHDGTKTYVFNYHSEYSHDPKRFNLPAVKEFTPEQWYQYSAERSHSSSMAASEKLDNSYRR